MAQQHTKYGSQIDALCPLKDVEIYRLGPIIYLENSLCYVSINKFLFAYLYWWLIVFLYTPSLVPQKKRKITLAEWLIFGPLMNKITWKTPSKDCTQTAQSHRQSSLSFIPHILHASANQTFGNHKE